MGRGAGFARNPHPHNGLRTLRRPIKDARQRGPEAPTTEGDEKMALPSQTERTSEKSRPIMTRNGGRGGGPDPKKIAVGAVTVLLIAGAAYGIMHWLPSGATTPSKSEAAPAP